MLAYMVPLSIQTLALRATTSDQLAEQVAEEYGLYVRLSEVWMLLGYNSIGAARRAAYDNRLGIATSTIPGRKGRMIRSRDLAQWLFTAARGAETVSNRQATQ
ncbi:MULTISPECIES: hypothetical protein [Stenotrophomonas maltophilia group]|uniref:hypothetical protein n=1 Tax=Stenotrophomonas maltophilia group TaxID=995085 RepID=UPI0018D48F9D|nr:hypothetical protein [Stenotrophomonas maltophilia]HDS1298846.1 hypothetical protein [Stenotrophomonas maltophilia]HDS1523945.1 hypothetical protein [Stenotrophomonas maltophilia]HDS1658784.1 hypothetical protein [Stenotrophomonas maltophilia]HDS1672667.1 hypothetical protein [Stenotrophomonas maltophilia]